MEGAVQHRNVDAQRVSPFTMAYYCIPTITLISDNREWSRRLMVWTEDTLFVAREKTLVESIPLHEILSVEEMNEDLLNQSDEYLELWRKRETSH